MATHPTLPSSPATGTVKVLNAFELDDGTRAQLESVSDRLVFDHRPAPDGIAPDATDSEAEILLAHGLPTNRSQMPALRWVQLHSAGIDHLDAGPDWDDVTLTSASGVYTVPIAEYVLGAILEHAQQARARRLERERRSWARRWELGGRPLVGATLLLIGYGSIGREVARLAHAFRMRIVAVKAHPGELADTRFREAGTGDPEGKLPDLVVGIEELPTVAAEADYAVVSLPLTERTRGLVNAEVLAAFPQWACLINVGRGAVVDEEALIAAVRRRGLAEAVLDVFADEPLPPGSLLWELEGITLTPHVSGGLERWPVFGALIAENLRRYMLGEPLLNVVEPARGY